ncbi:anti-sigma factor family protein [Sphingomonas sp. DT-204]|uniref:anti-sigma factor family protein n=1 Tax=Sphingomonas sp. DT-204 TaxID=3396166 RepID=UPI003F1C0EDF
MTIDPETLMAYADGELDPVAAMRVERAIAADPALAAEVAAHRRLRARIAGSFAPVAAAPVPERLALLLKPDNVVPLRPRARARFDLRWATAIAASLVIGLLIGPMLRPGAPVQVGPAGLVASGDLARALDTQLAATQGDAPIRVIASFRDSAGAICRTFAGRVTSGIACREGDGWVLRRTVSGAAEVRTDYRQAGSSDPELMAMAQDMMAGAPLDAAQERAAHDRGWR